jgi:hypothetical protein
MDSWPPSLCSDPWPPGYEAALLDTRHRALLALRRPCLADGLPIEFCPFQSTGSRHAGRKGLVIRTFLKLIRYQYVRSVPECYRYAHPSLGSNGRHFESFQLEFSGVISLLPSTLAVAVLWHGQAVNTGKQAQDNMVSFWKSLSNPKFI